MAELSRDGWMVPQIAGKVRCSQKTVRRWLHRFNRLGLEGLEDLGGQGRKRRITEAEHSRIIAMVKQTPPRRLEVQPSNEMWAADESGPPEWTLDSLAAAARGRGIEVSRSQVRRILLAEGVRRRRTRSWTGSRDADFGKRTRIVEPYTSPPAGATVVCADELGPVIPRAFPPAPGWSPDGHRIKSEIDYSRGAEKTWVYGTLRVRDGQELTMTATSRNSAFYQQFLQVVEDANPVGDIYVITDNLSSHNSVSTRTWLEDHPRIRHVFIPVGACWLNLQEGWWRIFRKTALAGRSFGDPGHITHATEVATAQLNARARPWIWGRPAPPTRRLRRRCVYTL
ncbi:IS630 family transposase [Streptomyces sp. NPDC002920]